MGQPYMVEYARSGRSKCSCKNAIDKDELRFGSWQEMGDQGAYRWRHWRCVTGRQIINVGGLDNLAGLDQLEEEHQELVREAFASPPDGKVEGGPVMRSVTEEPSKKKPAARKKKKKDVQEEEEDEGEEDIVAPAKGKAAAKGRGGGKKGKKQAATEREAEGLGQEVEEGPAPKKKKARGK